MTPGVSLLGFYFYFISSLCQSFALAKPSRPTNNNISRNTALRGTKCPGGADEFFFEGKIGKIPPDCVSVQVDSRVQWEDE